jgi:hypothetical protein
MRRLIPGLLLFLSTGLGVQEGSGQESPGDWVFSSLPQADLWFHGMALVDPIGPGPNPLYDPAYPSEMRKTKAAAGVSTTVLDNRSGYFRGAFQRDPAFEVLHFLPLYFPQAGRVEVLSALKVLAGTAEGIPRAPSVNTAFGLAAVGSVLTTRGQRTVLGEFVAALEEEWAVFYQHHWRERAAAQDQILASLQECWRVGYLPALTPFLDGTGMSGGLIALVPAIGTEGRIFGGSPQNPADNVLVLSAPSSAEEGREAVFSMLRELSFPAVRRVMDRVGGVTGDRKEAENLASRASIRSGALILERYRPEDLWAYQQFFLSQAPRSAPAGDAAEAVFREVFPLATAFETALREEIFSTKRYGGVG